MDALIFDFDGVVVDSEPIHLTGFQKVLAGVGVEMTRQDYYGKYLGFDDHDCLAAACAAGGVGITDEQIRRMTAAKTQIVQQVMADAVEALPGAADLIAAAAAEGVPLAICSGALRAEIDLAASAVGVRGHFAVVVAAEDVRRGKPDPEGYRLALEQLRRAAGRIDPARCVVVEDSPMGIAAAHQAGAKVLAVATSYPMQQLQAADRVVESLADVTLEALRRMVTPA